MPSNIEEIASFDDETKVWRTTCRCMGDDEITFMVSNDDDHPEVYLEMWTKSSSRFTAPYLPFWKRPFVEFWYRLKAAFKLVFKGYVEVDTAFLFRGEEHIDEFVDTIKTHKDYLVENKERKQDNG